MRGERLADREFTRRLSGAVIEPGAYGRVLRRPGGWTWMACTPSGHIGDLSEHDVEEHPDGTITVSPSIEIDGGKHVFVEGDDAEQFERVGLTGHWHGYLRAGVWESC